MSASLAAESPPPTTHTVLPLKNAAMVGSTRQSVNKVLGYFTDDGLIRVDREAILVLLGHAFEDLGMRLVELWGLAGNERALHTYERCGFRREARLRERSLRSEGWYEDHVVMSVTRPEFEFARAAFAAGAE